MILVFDIARYFLINLLEIFYIHELEYIFAKIFLNPYNHIKLCIVY